MMPQTLHDIDVSGKKILLRVDFNVPLTPSHEIADDERIRSATSTIRYLLSKNASVVIISHLGRPSGHPVPEFSLAPCARRLSELLGREVTFIPNCIGDEVRKYTSKIEPGEVVLLENLRFHLGEEDPQHHPEFAKELSKLGEIYINDAFGTCHRKHASIFYLPSYFEESAMGFLVEREVLVVSNLLTQAEDPFVAIVGGSKVSSKIGILESLLERVSALFIGGAMAFTFLKVKGFQVGNSLVDENHLDQAKSLCKKAKSRNVALHLPEDFVIAPALKEGSETSEIDIELGIPSNRIGGDIGSKTIEKWKAALRGVRTVFWNGPLGVFELTPFRRGTLEIARQVAESGAMSIVGGGDSTAALKMLGLDQKITHLSTGRSEEHTSEL